MMQKFKIQQKSSPFAQKEELGKRIKKLLIQNLYYSRQDWMNDEGKSLQD
jgi:hypothetical protein